MKNPLKYVKDTISRKKIPLLISVLYKKTLIKQNSSNS